MPAVQSPKGNKILYLHPPVSGWNNFWIPKRIAQYMYCTSVWVKHLEHTPGWIVISGGFYGVQPACLSGLGQGAKF